MSRPLLIALALLALPSCGQDPKAADVPSAGDLAITGEEKSAQANAEQQVAAAVAVAQSRTLDARVARLEAEVDALKAEAATSESLKSALADIGSSASAPPPLPVVMPHMNSRTSAPPAASNCRGARPADAGADRRSTGEARRAGAQTRTRRQPRR